MGLFLLFLLLASAIIVALHPVTLFLHEMGHALPALLFTRGRVTVYLGSYGDPEKSWKLRLGRLEFFVARHPFWMRGLCVPGTGDLALWQSLLIALLGPLSSAIVAAIAAAIIFSYNMHGLLKLVAVLLAGLSILDLMANLIPSGRTVRLYDGTVSHNDGGQLLHLLRYRKFGRSYSSAAELFTGRRYAEAAAAAQVLLRRYPEVPEVHHLAVGSLTASHRYAEALELELAYASRFSVGLEGEALYAYLLVQHNRKDEGLALLARMSGDLPGDLILLHTYAYALLLSRDYEAALPLFTQVIDTTQDEWTKVCALDNRGLCRVMTGDPEGGLEDIREAEKYDPGNAYVVRNLGIYHLQSGRPEQALALLARAREIDPAIDDLAYWTEMAQCQQDPTPSQRFARNLRLRSVVRRGRGAERCYRLNSVHCGKRRVAAPLFRLGL